VGGRVRVTFCRWAAPTAWTRERTRQWTNSRRFTTESRGRPCADSHRRSWMGGGNAATRPIRRRRRHR